MSQRTYHDPLHLNIKLDDSIPEEAMVIGLIDSAPFQRLRRIKQLGPAFLTFHGAESSRFTHSIGVFHIARRVFERLLEFNPNLSKDRAVLYGASLLHDIGHGPLSHTSEVMFGLNHEEWSAKIIRGHEEIKSHLNYFDKDLGNQIASLLEGKNNYSPILKSLISSQLDCDRLDYLMRDSYSTGTQYGQLDLERILSAITISPDGDFAIHPKGVLAVEHYLVVRNLMYRSVYNHRLNEVCNWLLERIIKTARELGPKKVWSDNHMHQWLWEPNAISLESFLANDDTRTFYHFLRWQEEGPNPLNTLCKSFLNRKLLKALDLGDMNQEMQLKALSIAMKLTNIEGKDPDLYCGLRQNKIKGYHPYKKGLRIWDGNKLKALEEESMLVQKLMIPTQDNWLIYPKEIHLELINSLASLTNHNRVK